MADINRPALVGRMLAAAYPDGVPPDQVEHIPRRAAALDAIAESIASGKPFGGFPLTLAGDPGKPALFDVPAYEIVRIGPVADEPVPFVASSPPTPTEAPKPTLRKNIPYEDLPVGILHDGMVAEIAGCASQSVYSFRAKHGIAPAPPRRPRLLVRGLALTWGRERLLAWLERWPRARELYGADIDAALVSPPAEPDIISAPPIEAEGEPSAVTGVGPAERINGTGPSATAASGAGSTPGADRVGSPAPHTEPPASERDSSVTPEPDPSQAAVTPAAPAPAEPAAVPAPVAAPADRVVPCIHKGDLLLSECLAGFRAGRAPCRGCSVGARRMEAARG